jgi:hypothetical protein
MTYLARLVAITEDSGVTQDILPFVHFQGQQKKVEITDDTKVAILQIENIPSYHVVFLESEMKLADLESELEKNDTVLSRETKAILSKHMK